MRDQLNVNILLPLGCVSAQEHRSQRTPAQAYQRPEQLGEDSSQHTSAQLGEDDRGAPRLAGGGDGGIG